MIDHRDEIQRRTAINLMLSTPALPLVGRFEYDVSPDQLTRPVPIEVINTVVTALQAGQTHYVDVPGIAKLRELMAHRLQSEKIANAISGGVVVTAGVQEARFLTVQVLSETFGSVAVPDVIHPGMRNALGVRIPKEVLWMKTAREFGYLTPVTEIQRSLASGTRLLVLEMPGRLTGAVYSADDIYQITELVVSHDAHIIWDAGYFPWAIPSLPAFAMQPALANRVTVIGEAIAGAGLEAWSLGFIADHPDNIAGFVKLKQIMSICTSTPSQLAAIEILEQGLDDHQTTYQRTLKVREHLVKAIDSAGGKILPGACAHVVAFEHDDKTTPTGTADGAAFGVKGASRIRVDEKAATVFFSGLRGVTGELNE